MAELKDISTLLDSKSRATYPKYFKPIILASWVEVRPEEGLKNLFSKLSTMKMISEKALYFALPPSLISTFSKIGEATGFAIGSHPVAEEERAPRQSDEGIKPAFTLIDSHDFLTTSLQGVKKVRDSIAAHLDERLPTFVLVGETAKERIDAAHFDQLSNEVHHLIHELSDAQLEYLSLIYSPSWTTIQGMRGLEENFAKSYHLFRNILSDAIGELRAAKIRVMGCVPSMNASFYPYMVGSDYEGFYFPNIALYENSFIRTCDEIENKDPDFLEVKATLGLV